MILDPLDIPDELLEAQERGRLVVFAGAGVSRGAPSDLPDFKGLAVDVAKGTQFESQLSKHEQRLDRFFGELARGEIDIQQLARRRIGNPASQPTDLHRWILDLFLNPKDIRIVTTNFDTHFTSLLTERKLKLDQYFAPALPLGRSFRGIVYLHGSLLREDDPLILSDEDFGRAYMTDGWARDFLRGMFDTYTTLFVGYSHTDPPVEYLARGMSGIHVAPRYALVSKGDEDWWNSLKVKPITFTKPGGGADFSELGRGLKSWARFSKDQPTDIAQKVRDILRSPPEVKPAKSQSSLLVRCLSRKDSCHYYTDVAEGWHWVVWANEEGLLKPLFGPTPEASIEKQWRLAGWLAKMLIAEPSDKGFLLVAEHGGAIGNVLWQRLCSTLWTDDKVDYASPIIQKWILLIISSCPSRQNRELGHLIQKVGKAIPKTLGLTLLRFLTAVRVSVSSGFALDFGPDPETVTTRPRPEFDLELVGESYHMEQAWETVFKPLIPELGRDLLRILEDRLREMYAMVRAAGKFDARHDPWCMRGSIRDRDIYRNDHDTSQVVDFLLDVVEAMSAHPNGLPPSQIEDWLSAECPTLTRIGLLALRLSKFHSAKNKVALLLELQLLYPQAFGAEHETYAVLVASYSELSPAERTQLWEHIVAGPKYLPSEGVNPEGWAEHCQRQIDNLTFWLATRNTECPLASAAFKSLKQRVPEFLEHEVVDRAIQNSGVVDMGQSPKSPSDLLAQSIDSQIDFLLTYKGENWPSGVSRPGLVAAVGDACAQNPQWAISLFEELARRQNWTSDLWEGAFWRLRLSSLPTEKLTWLLDIFDKHFAHSPSLQGLTFFLFNGVEFTDQKAPTEEVLQALIRISHHIWNQLKSGEPPKTEAYETTEWTSLAINHPGGRIAEFWVKCWSYIRQKSGATNGGWPDWLCAPLEDMVEGGSYAAQLGRVILGHQLTFLHAIDAPWVRARLFPKFHFSQVADEAFILWEPHLKYGRLSRDLIIEMLPLYRQAFPHFHAVKNEFAVQLYKHTAIIIYSCLVDVNQDGWLQEFLLGLTEEQRAAWAHQMEFVLRSYPSDRKQIIWDKWLKDYWQGRLLGKPCKLTSKEAGEMLVCATSLEPVFPAAVDFVLLGPPVSNRISTVLHQLESNSQFQKQPAAVVRLLKWQLTNSEEEWLFPDDVHKALMKLPKLKSFVPDLIAICDQLARRGYSKAVDLKAEILREFINV